jgi:hypothetical protein
MHEQTSTLLLAQCRPLGSSRRHICDLHSSAVRFSQGYEGPMPSNHPPVRPSPRPNPSTEAAVAAGKQPQLSSTARLVTYANANIWTADIEVRGAFRGALGCAGVCCWGVLGVLLGCAGVCCAAGVCWGVLLGCALRCGHGFTVRYSVLLLSLRQQKVGACEL